MRRTSLDESTMPLLCRQLKMNCTLRILHLEDNHLSGILVRNLGKQPIRTNHVTGYQPIRDQYLLILSVHSQFLTHISTVWGLRGNAMLQDLYLGHNKLTPEDAKLLNSLLKDNHTIRLLDLRNNRLQVLVLLEIVVYRYSIYYFVVLIGLLIFN